MKRIQMDQYDPKAYEAMFGLEHYLKQSGISQNQKDLIKIRASQINGCAYCIAMHTHEAIKNGESPGRIFLLDAWTKADVFSEKEKVLLGMTEEITFIHRRGLSDELYNKALQLFSEKEFSEIVMTINTINAWNRIAIATLKPTESSDLANHK